MIRSSAHPWSIVALVAVLTGCATVPPPASEARRTVDAAQLPQWLAKGRIALVAHGEGGSGSFVWDQRGERTELAVRGPLGAGGFSVVTDGESLQVDDGSGRPIDGEAAREAIEHRLGTLLPLGHFRYWMLGVPAPGGSGPVVREPGSDGFTQQGWAVSYEAFRQAGPWSLPARMTATTGDARVRIVVDDWQLPLPKP